MFSSCNPKFFAVRHIHYPVNTSSDHFPTDAVVPSSDHCHTDTVLPPSEQYCIEAVAPSGDHSLALSGYTMNRIPHHTEQVGKSRLACCHILPDRTCPHARLVWSGRSADTYKRPFSP